MVGITAGMMLANRRIIIIPETLLVNRRMIAGEIDGTIMEFYAGEFGQIMLEGMEENPHVPGVGDDAMAMLLHGEEMLKRMTHGMNDITKEGKWQSQLRFSHESKKGTIERFSSGHFRYAGLL